MLDIYTQRRQVVAAQIRDLIQVRGPRTANQRATLESLLAEDQELEHGVSSEHEQRRMAALPSWFQGRLSDKEATLLPPLSKRDMTEAGLATGAATAGGILAVPLPYNHSVISSMKDYSRLIELATIVPSDTPGANSGANMPFPLDLDANMTGELTPENQQRTLGDISAPGQVILSSYKFDSKELRISRELLQDQSIDLPAYTARIFGVRLGRIMSQMFTIGTGNGQPTGFMNSSTIINAGTAVGAAGSTGYGGSIVLISPSDLGTLESAVDVAYRSRAKIMLSPSTLQSLRAATSSTGAVLYPGLHNSPDGVNRLLNYEVVTNPAMDALQTTPGSPPTTTRPIAFADFSRYTIRMLPILLQRLDEKWAEFFQVSYIAYSRADGNFTDAGACAAYLEVTY
jgi:HK97 family phage major capsid protein